MEWLTTEIWVILAVVAVGVGITKTAMPGLGTLLSAILASVMPARASTGLLLLVLIVGDILAVAIYRRSADHRVLLGLFLPMAVGLLLGAGFLQIADDADVRVTIGLIVLAMLAIEVTRRWLAHRRTRHRGTTMAVSDAAVATGADPPPSTEKPTGAQRVAAWLYGALAGFTTMVANAAGPVVSVYFLSMRYTKLQFMGTAAWLFFVVNIAKAPLSVAVGIITWDTVRIAALLVPGVLLGGLVGRWLFSRINQKVFDGLVLVLSALAAINLLR